MKINKLAIVFFALSIIFFSCEKDEEVISQDYLDGILISGEGSAAGTGSISYLTNDLGSSENLIYKKVNSEELGTFLQSICFSEDKAYISVDESHTVTVVNRYTFEKISNIKTGLIRPRFMTILDGFGYSTNWGSKESELDDFIAVIDLTSNLVVRTIPVKFGPEQIVAKNGKLYVSHKGTPGTNNIISVIDTSNDTVVEITVGDKPDELFFDESGTLFVLTEGDVMYNADWSAIINETLANIITIDPMTNNITKTLSFAQGEHPSLFTISNNKLYYELSNNIYEMNVSATELPTTPIITTTGYTYGLEVRGNQLFSIDANFSGLSELSVYDLGTKTKTDSFEVALGASKIYFNE